MGSLDNITLSTVEVCNGKMEHKGQGLLLLLEKESLILTCHHVIAETKSSDLFIRMREGNGKLSGLIPAIYDPVHSNPSNDIVILQIQTDRKLSPPLLQSINPDRYSGRLPVTGFSFMEPGNFDATLSTAVSLDLNVPAEGEYMPMPNRYIIPVAFRLSATTDSRPGISGAPIMCGEGILGLTHFARGEGVNTSREAYLVPVTAWLKNWPELGKYIKPFVDRNMLQAAAVKPVSDIAIGTDFVMEGYKTDIFLERKVFDVAKNSLKGKGIIIVGKPKSGKTRLVFELLREYPDSIIVIPFRDRPPDIFESAGFSGKNLFLFFDDLHLEADSIKVMQWHQQLSQSGASQCKVICTSRAGEDWKNLKEGQRQLIRELGEKSIVLISRVEENGEDMTLEEGLQLAGSLNIDETEFEERFDGTPGSLTLNLKDMAESYKRLRDEDHDGVPAAIFLDASKLLHVCDQPRLAMDLIFDISAHFLGGKVLSSSMQNILLRRVEEEGFGQFEKMSKELKIYRPYLEECVSFEPVLNDTEALFFLLADKKDFVGIANFAAALSQSKYYELSEKAARTAIDGGELSALGTLASILSNQPGKEEEAEEAYLAAIKNGYHRDAWCNLGGMLSSIPGREADAEKALRHATETDTAFIAYLMLGDLLSAMPGREKEAEEAYNRAIVLEGFKFFAYRGLANLLASMEDRKDDAELAFRSAIEAGKDGNDPLNYTPELYLALARILEDTPGRDAEAEGYFRAAVDASVPNAKLFYYLFLSGQEGREGEFRKAVDELLFKKDPLGHYLNGYILLDEERAEEALSAFRLARDQGIEIAESAIQILEKQTEDG